MWKMGLAKGSVADCGYLLAIRKAPVKVEVIEGSKVIMMTQRKLILSCESV